MNKVSRLILATALLLGIAATPARAQSSCSSDGQARPQALLERFINADCESCWSDAKVSRPASGELALDWIVPGSRGQDAPLAAAAIGDGATRLDALGRKVPLQADSSMRTVQGSAPRLRVAHGLPFNGYVGASIELKPGSGGPWRAWLLLVETLAAGTEGSPVERNLVRNVLQVAWDEGHLLPKEEQPRRIESRSLSIPEGAKGERLRVVGWVEDARSHIRAIAQSRCAWAPSKG
jgi:hypothetical protein